MASENWFSKLESAILTIVKTRMKKNSKFSNVDFTTEISSTPTKFPTVSFEELQPEETGQNLNNDTVNAVIETIQVIAYTNTTKADCKDLMTEVTLQFKKIGFNVSMMPVYSKSGNVHQGIARFRRMVGAGDRDLVPQ